MRQKYMQSAVVIYFGGLIKNLFIGVWWSHAWARQAIMAYS